LALNPFRREKHPVVFEVVERGRNIEGSHLNISKTCLLEQIRQRTGPADGRLYAIIELLGAFIQLGCRVEEVSHDLHMTSVVPDVQGNNAARTDYRLHFCNGLILVSDKIKDESRDRHRKLAVFE
jgi:hypothetical protein